MYYPVMLNIKNKKIAIIGGGKVAFRKAKNIIKAGGKLTVISPVICDEFERLENVTFLKEYYKKDYIEGFFIVIAATDNSLVNEQIYKDCDSLNILCNIVDNKDISSFITPAVVDNDSINIAITTNGSFPSLSKYIKDDLKDRYDRFDEEYIAILEEIRKIMIKKDYKDRNIIFREILELDKCKLKEFLSSLAID